MKTSLPGSERFPTQYNWDSLFDELCRAHGLKWRQKRLLKSISQALNIVPVARLFIEPDWFVAASKTPDLQSRKSQLIELCEELFYREKKGNSPIVPLFQDDSATTTSETFTRIY